MQASSRDASRHLVHAFWAVRQRLDASVGAPLAEATGLDLMEFVLLEYAAMTDLSPTEIAAAVRVPEHTVSRRLGSLERAGLLHRRIDPDDGRRRTLMLTGAGRARLAEARDALGARLGPMLDELGATRVAALLDALTAFAAADDRSTTAAP
jgi:MarR family transcriptional regulator, organic hydroperoxide resistance regulator